MTDFDKLIKRASQPIQLSAQTDGQNSGDYTDKKTHSDKTEDTSDSQNYKSPESNASTDSKSPQ